jgi:hypothetical protein
MNHVPWARAAARVAAAAFVLAAASACDRNKAADARESATPSPSANVIGVEPAKPTGDTPETTPASKPQNELTKTDETRNMPLEGQDSSHMTESTKDSQRAGSTDDQTQRRPQ